MASDYLTEYTHIDGSRWTGPAIRAASLKEAQSLAMEYPVQPLVVLGELIETVDMGPDVARFIKAH